MKAKKYLLIIFIIFVVLDITTSLYGFYVNKHTEMEINPLFVITGNIWFQIIANIIVIRILLFFYNKNNPPFMNFIYTSAIIYMSAAKIPFIIQAFRFIKEPVSKAAFESITATQKVSEFSYFILIQFFIPVILICLTYLIWKIDYDIKIKEAKK